MLYLLIWLISWIVIGGIVFVIWGREEPATLLGVALAALLSLVLMFFSLSSRWEGEIVDVRMETERNTDDDGHTWTQQVRYAYVRRSNGKRKKIRAMPQWQTGDRLEKRRGEMGIRHYPRA